MVKEYVSFEDANLGAGLGEAFQEGTRGRGVETSLTVASQIFPNYKTNGVMPELTYANLTSNTKNGWTARKGSGRGNFCFDPETGFILDTIDQGYTARTNRTTISLNATKSFADAWKIQKKMTLNAHGGRKLLGFYNSANTNVVNFAGIFHNNIGTFHCRFYDSSGTLTNSVASTSGYLEGNSYSFEIEHVPGSTTLFVRAWKDATNNPGDVGTSWSGPDETLSVSTSGKTISLNEFGWSAITANYNGFQEITKQIFCDAVDFNSYTTASPMVDVVQVAFDGTIDPTNAELIILKNGIAQPLDSPLVKIRVKVDGVIVTGPPDFVLFSVYQGIGVMTPGSTMDYSFQIINPNIEDKIQIVDFNPGESVAAVPASDFPEVENTLDIDTTDGVQGTATLPTAGETKSGVVFGVGGNGTTGNRTDPTIGNVKTGIQYGASGNEFTGNRVIAAVADVRDGVLYGAAGTELEGELVVGGVTVSSPVVGEIEFTLQSQIQFEVQNN